MLENTLGGSKERVEETGQPCLSLVTHSCTRGGDFAICCLSAVKTREAGDVSHASISSYISGARLTLERSLFSFISRLRSCKHTRRHSMCVEHLRA